MLESGLFAGAGLGVLAKDGHRNPRYQNAIFGDLMGLWFKVSIDQLDT